MSDETFEEAARRLMDEAVEEEARRNRGGRVRTPPPTLSAIDPAIKSLINAKVVRRYVLDQVIEPVIGRLYDIGMGIETFDVPTAIGRIVNVPASAQTQVKALLGLVAIGIPQQMGLVDDTGDSLPGVFALGPLQLDEARASALNGRFVATASLAPGAPPVPEAGDALDDALSPGMLDRVAAGEMEVVEIEATEAVVSSDDDQPPAPLSSEPTLEQQILARRRSRRTGRNGSTGTNGATP